MFEYQKINSKENLYSSRKKIGILFGIVLALYLVFIAYVLEETMSEKKRILLELDPALNKKMEKRIKKIEKEQMGEPLTRAAYIRSLIIKDLEENNGKR